MDEYRKLVVYVGFKRPSVLLVECLQLIQSIEKCVKENKWGHA